MNKAVIVDAVRTPIAKADEEKGWFRSMRADDLAVICVKALLERTRVDPGSIDDLILGCANQQGTQALNAARAIGLLAGLPEEVTAITIDRQCASAMTAIHNAAMAIMANYGDIFICGGFESMTLNPRGSGAIQNPRIAELYDIGDLLMASTGEKVAELYNVSREEQDEFSLISHRKAVAAQKEGRFKDEIIPVEVTYEDGSVAVIDKDQFPREDTTLERMAALKPAFKDDGTITAANASGHSDSACAVMVMSEEKADELGLKPLAAIKSMAVVGVDPTIMGVGPIVATRKALKSAGLTIDDIDLIEINEAFASQCLYCIRELGMDMEKVNVNGGACALGHPVGASGARIVVTLLHEMVRRKARYGLATLCVGMGQGAATIFERS